MSKQAAASKQAAPMQITAEQILREAHERQEDDNFVPPKSKIMDPEELAVYRLRERKHFEDRLRMSRNAMGTWLKYAAFEEAQRDFERARSVYERALDVDHRNSMLWLKYAEMEMRNRHINHARNVWDRAVTLMPRMDQFWFKYIYMEEMLGSLRAARHLFDRWLAWEPDDHAWSSYMRLELRANQPNRARAVLERYVTCHNVPRAWIKWAKFEEQQADTTRAREVFERALQELDERDHTQELFMAFGAFEERAKEADRARVIYKYALDTLPKSQAEELYKRYVQFEKQHGDRAGIEDVITSKKRFAYEELVKQDPFTYDTWFDYLKLEEGQMLLDADRTRDIYERAIANVPPVPDKRVWRRYIYIWLRYAIFEELRMKDIDRSRQVLAQCRKILPHSHFTFAKLWVHCAHFEVRQGQVGAARRLLGRAIGCCPKEKIFKAYVQLELQLGEIERCRELYAKYMAWAPSNCMAWVAFAELEASLGELQRCRAIYELAVSQSSLDMPETLWKAYIDFEISQEDWERTRKLYKMLLERTKHIKVWISFAQFEEETAGHAAADAVYRNGEAYFKEIAQKGDRALLLQTWRDAAAASGDSAREADIVQRMPTRIKKKRHLQTEDGEPAGYEEFYDFVFPEEDKSAPSLKILDMAQKWKRQKMAHAAC
jgi:crooked neck